MLSWTRIPGNNIGAIYIPLLLDDGEPLQRLASVHKLTQRLALGCLKTPMLMI